MTDKRLYDKGVLTPFALTFAGEFYDKVGKDLLEVMEQNSLTDVNRYVKHFLLGISEATRKIQEE